MWKLLPLAGNGLKELELKINKVKEELDPANDINYYLVRAYHNFSTNTASHAICLVFEDPEHLVQQVRSSGSALRSSFENGKD